MEPLYPNTLNLLAARHTLSPRRLVNPGPSTEQRELILEAPRHAPDHGQLVPWRFIELPTASRHRLGQVFVQSLLDRDPAATTEQQSQAAEKAERAPWLLAAVLRQSQKDQPEVPDTERLISLGCAIQNMLLMATALGFGSALTSGKALNHPAMRQLLSLESHELLTCFVNIGTASKPAPPRERPAWQRYVSTLKDA